MKRKMTGGLSRLLCATAILATFGGVAKAGELFDLNALIEAAKKEKPITVYDSTGKIVEMAKNFSKKYGVGAKAGRISGV